MKVSDQLRLENVSLSPSTVRNLWIKESLETRYKRLLRMEEEKAGKAVQPRKDNVKKFTSKQAVQAGKPVQAGNVEGRKPENEMPVPDQGKVETALQPDAPALPPIEAKAQKGEVERAGGIPEKAPKVTARGGQTVKSGNGNGNGKDKSDKIPMMSEAQKSAIYNLSRRCVFNNEIDCATFF